MSKGLIISYHLSKDNSLENLVTVCRPCHGKIHMNEGFVGWGRPKGV